MEHLEHDSEYVESTQSSGTATDTAPETRLIFADLGSISISFTSALHSGQRLQGNNQLQSAFDSHCTCIWEEFLEGGNLSIGYEMCTYM